MKYFFVFYFTDDEVTKMTLAADRMKNSKQKKKPGIKLLLWLPFTIDP